MTKPDDTPTSGKIISVSAVAAWQVRWSSRYFILQKIDNISLV